MTFGEWKALWKIGEGGQGEVYQVARAETLVARNEHVTQLREALARFRGVTTDPVEAAQAILRIAAEYVRPIPEKDMAAAKKYRIPDGQAGVRPRQRLEKEIEALSLLAGNPAVLTLLGSDLPEGWIVTEFHPEILSNVRNRYEGKALEAFLALRPVVAAVADLHERGMIHRDIKTPNIFIASDGRLVLGDFGIVFYEDPQKVRVTESFERVGTRDWMPPWTHTGMRLDEVPPTFDVFALGKVLWSMVSGKPYPLPYWYWKRKVNNLEDLFPSVMSDMRFVNRVIAHSVCEDEKQCFPTGGALLALIDECVEALAGEGQIIRNDLPKPCRVCGRGHYQESQPGGSRVLLVAAQHRLKQVQAVGDLIDLQNRITVRLFKCDNCGHLEIFDYPDGHPPAAWLEPED